ncbi:DNA -binding domain-containing protein [Methylocystis parvus]|uniref:DUF2285 domain-containing protein n=1 Tax=Methylocystis parvus TaxID=134 RepID=A0A6B8MB08_9HYPH|nr:DUF2285 domain-containing protein [Methylocystis parvus]QGM99891.1 DUF2285 domain-containing protein [Methylocystis parvus]WBK02316.1 DUF2285 domain-containing protein [Methylocystis parvus OBBP]
MSSENADPIADIAPSDEHVTDYDRAHFKVYLRMLDAAKEGAAWEEISSIVLGIDSVREPARARRAYDTHLARAQWLANKGYKDLLAGPA